MFIIGMKNEKEGTFKDNGCYLDYVNGFTGIRTCQIV